MAGPLFLPVARAVPYDDQNIPTNLGDDVQEALDNIYNIVVGSASPGYTWGRSGNVTSNSWLQNDTVPSNLAGRTIGFSNAYIKKIFVANENINTFNLAVYEHDGTTYTLLQTVSIVAARAASFSFPLGIAVTTGKELAAKVSSGSAKNLVISISLTGTL